jgi:hypothetical protein
MSHAKAQSSQRKGAKQFLLCVFAPWREIFSALIGMVLSPRAFPARQSRRALGRFPSHGSSVAGSDPHFAFACKAHFPCRASPVGPWPRRTIHAILGWLPLLLRNIRVRVCYSSSQGRCCMALTGPPIVATAKRLSPKSLARSPYPTSPSLRRNEDARPAKFSGQSKVP